MEEAAPHPEVPPATDEIGPNISKEMYEARRSEGIRAVFRLAGLLLLRASGTESSQEAALALTASLQQATEFIPSLPTLLRSYGMETPEDATINDQDAVIALVQDLFACISAAAQPVPESDDVASLRKKLASLAPRAEDSDEVGMDRLRKFAAFLQEWRSSRLSQMQFLDLMHAHCPVKYTQTCLSRFEKGNLSYQSMRRMHGYIEKTMLAFAENPFSAPATVRKRKQRETISTQIRQTLEQHFSVNQRPSLEQLQNIARNLNLSLETTRYWFQNARSGQKKGRPSDVAEIGCRPEPSAESVPEHSDEPVAPPPPTEQP